MSNIDFTDYERIQDTLMYLTDKITLSFVLALSKKSLSGQRSFFHYETQYKSDAYGAQLRAVKRNMNYYFLISNKDVFGSGILLRPQDIEILLMIIQRRVLPWFFGTKEEHAFHMVNNTMVLKEYSPVVFSQSENKYIIFEPVVYHYENTEQFAEGIAMRFAGGDECVMTVDKFMGFINIIKSDMYAIAANLANYVKMQPYGVNVYSPVGLGASSDRDNSAWSSQKAYKGFGSNSFLDNAKEKTK